MSRRMFAVLAVTLWTAAPAPAQLGPAGIAAGGGFGFAYQSRRFAAAGGFGFAAYRSWTPFGFGFGGTSFTGFSSQFLAGPGTFAYYGPGWGPGPFAPPWMIPPVQVLVVPQPPPPPVIIVIPPNPPRNDPNDDDGRFIRIAPRGQQVNGRLPAGGFGRVQPAPDRERLDPFKPMPRLPGPLDGKPAADPKAEAERQIAAGRQAFRQGHYGRAVEKFARAIQLNPDDPMTYFVLAQSYLPLGKYAEASAAIHAGVRRRPNWPMAPFRPKELHAEPGDFDASVANLRAALAAHPDDPVLLFLLGYQLWFNDQRDEARELFRRARPRAANPDVIDRFLDDADGRVVRK